MQTNTRDLEFYPFSHNVSTMTCFLRKIANQIITNCKFNIVNFRSIRLGKEPKGSMGSLNDVKVEVSVNFDDASLWDENFDELIPVLRSCNELYEIFSKQINITFERNKHWPEDKPYIDKNEVTRKFNLFKARVEKLIKFFKYINNARKGKDKFSNTKPFIFNEYFDSVRAKMTYPLLDFYNDAFDREYEVFNADMTEVANLFYNNDKHDKLLEFTRRNFWQNE